MKKILVPVDGSKCSYKALDQAVELARLTGASLSLILVSDTGRFSSSLYELSLVEEFILQGARTLDMIMERVKDFDGPLDKFHAVGDSADEIIKLAEEGNYDLVVMGSRGLGAFSRALLGSVSNRVINHIKVSVLIVK